jgi:hypothetical protein
MGTLASLVSFSAKTIRDGRLPNRRRAVGTKGLGKINPTLSRQDSPKMPAISGLKIVQITFSKPKASKYGKFPTRIYKQAL